MRNMTEIKSIHPKFTDLNSLLSYVEKEALRRVKKEEENLSVQKEAISKYGYTE